MIGETDLNTALRNLKPSLNNGDYVFCSTDNFQNIDLNKSIGFIREKEGYSIILEKDEADNFGFKYTSVYSWITLNIYTALDLVGLTAVISKEFSQNNISCNIVAAFYHDHIFVDRKNTQLAIKILKSLKTKTYRNERHY